MIKYLPKLKLNKETGYFILAALGAYQLFQKSLSILSELRSIVFDRFDKSRYGDNYWAVVSGASDGIGLGFVEELAKRGIHVVLLVRNREKSESVVRQLSEKYPNVNFKIVIINFSTTDIQEYERVYKELENLDIGILVNNVGTGAILQIDKIEDVKNQVIINTLPQTLLTKLFLDKLTKRKSKSAIINLSSVAANGPMPLMSLYAASKAFDDFLSRGLHYEYKGQIDIQSLKPSHVKTPLSKFIPEGIFTITSNQCAEGSLNRLKFSQSTHGHIAHRIQTFLQFNIFPEFIQKKLIYQFWKDIIEKESKKAQKN